MPMVDRTRERRPDPSRICVKCIWYKRTDGPGWVLFECLHPTVKLVDLVDGHVSYPSPFSERRPEGNCGPEGKNYQRKEPNDRPV